MADRPSYAPTSLKESFEGHGKASQEQPQEQSTNTMSDKKTVWKKNQPVKHQKYGIGTIENIDVKVTGEIHIMVKFKHSTKKIVAEFLQRL